MNKPSQEVISQILIDNGFRSEDLKPYVFNAVYAVIDYCNTSPASLDQVEYRLLNVKDPYQHVAVVELIDNNSSYTKVVANINMPSIGEGQTLEQVSSEEVEKIRLNGVWLRAAHYGLIIFSKDGIQLAETTEHGPKGINLLYRIVKTMFIINKKW